MEYEVLEDETLQKMPMDVKRRISSGLLLKCSPSDYFQHYVNIISCAANCLKIYG